MPFINAPNLRSVKGFSNTPPGSPAIDELWILGTAPTGAWSGQGNKYARWNGSSWDYITPSTSSLVWTLDTSTIYIYNTSNQWAAPTAGGLTGGVTNQIPYWTSSTALGNSVLKQVTSKIGLITTADSPEALFQVLKKPSDYGGYSFSNWNSGGQALTSAFGCPTDNGGTTPSALFPALVLNREGQTGTAYANFIEFKVGRWEHSGNAARSALTLALTHGSGDASGTDVAGFFSDKRVETYGDVLRLNATTASTTSVNIQVSNDTNRPALRWNGSTTKWQFSNNGTTFTDFAGAGGTTAPFDDTTDIIRNVSDNTKIIRFSAAAITTLTTRTLTAPDASTTIVGTDVTQTLTNKTITNSNNTLGGVTIVVGSDATGDIWYRNSSGIFTRLGIGSSGQVLTVSSGLPSWQTSGAGSAPPFSDASALVKNDADNSKLLIFSAASITTSTTRTITIPDANTTMVGTDVTQTLTNKTITNSNNTLGGVTMSLGSDATGDIYYRNSSGILTRLGIGSAGQVLTVTSGLPSWAASGGGGGITGSGTAKRLVIWTGTSSIGDSKWREDTTNTRTAYNPAADPDTTYPRAAINGLPEGNGSTINWGNWNSTSVVVPFLIRGGRDNGGSSMIAPTPLITFGLDGVSGQSFGSDAAISMNRYSTGSTSSFTRVVIQANNGGSEYPSDIMSFYGTGRAGIGNGSTSISDNDAKALFHVGNQLINAGTNFSTSAWNSGGLVPLLAVWDADDAASTTTHPPLILAKKGVSAGQEAQRVEFGLGRWESSSNAPRTRFDIRLAHAVNETRSFRVATFMSYGGFGVGQTDGISATTNFPDATLQVGDTPDNQGSYSITSWNSSGNRVRNLVVTPTDNGGGSPSAAEPAIVLARRGVFASSYSNYIELKVSRYENAATAARSALTIAATHATGDASGTDVVEFRSDKSTNFKGQAGCLRNTQTGNGSQTVDWNLGNTFEHTLNGATTTFTFSNGKAGFEYTILIIQDATGSRLVTWPSSVKWPGGTAPTLTITANKIDVFKFYYNGTDYINISQLFNL